MIKKIFVFGSKSLTNNKCSNNTCTETRKRKKSFCYKERSVVQLLKETFTL